MWLRNFGIDPRRALRGWAGLRRFRRDRRAFREGMGPEFQWGPELPICHEWDEPSGSLGAYFLQDLTVARWVRDDAPRRHVDVGSRLDGFVGSLAVFREVEVIDIRPASTTVTGIRFHQLDLTAPLPDRWVGATDSLSCLHSIEHFGLGRYGDPVDANGHLKGLEQLKRMVAPGGRFYLSTPIGPQRVEFNAHRVFSASTLIGWFDAGWEIERFALIDDATRLLEEPERSAAAVAENFGCRLGVGIVAARRSGLDRPGGTPEPVIGNE